MCIFKKTDKYKSFIDEYEEEYEKIKDELEKLTKYNNIDII